MRQTAITAMILLLLLPSSNGVAGSEKFVSVKPPAAKVEGTRVTIEGTSTIHDWKMEGAAIQGSIQSDPATWVASSEPAASVKVAIRVDSIRSEHGKMDDLMQKALKASSNPEIRYELLSAKVTKVAGETIMMATNGKLTIAGATRDLAMDITATRLDDSRYVITGEAPIRMPDYGIKPPTAMLGTIKTGPDVKISFRWVVGRS